MKYLSIIILLFNISCLERELTVFDQTNTRKPLSVHYDGYDINNIETSCNSNVGPVCTMVFTSEDHYSNKCKEAGGVSYQCECHKFLCSKNIEYNVSAYYDTWTY
jgi:hypothetical protein